MTDEKKAPTTYVVLEFDSQDNSWVEVDTVPAQNSQIAISRVASEGCTYVAIPQRSWKPIGASVETKRRVVLGKPTESPEE